MKKPRLFYHTKARSTIVGVFLWLLTAFFLFLTVKLAYQRGYQNATNQFSWTDYCQANGGIWMRRYLFNNDKELVCLFKGNGSADTEQGEYRRPTE